MIDYTYNFSGKTILVTGASSGIGKQISMDCAKAGATVIMLGRDEERLNQTLSQLEGDGHQVITGDLKDEKFIESACKALPPLDGVVQSAGMMKLVPLKFINAAFIDEMLAINLRAPILLVTTLQKLKKIKPASSVVLLSSINGAVIGSPANSVYGATKGGLQSFCKSASLELAKTSIRINCIAPAMVETEGTAVIGEHVSAEAIEADKKNYPLGRYGTPADIAGCCLFLLSGAGSWITGTTITIDGGFTAQ
ncbi:SDR family NAD(P)-dependent oxidoreductase [Mucilaginibacter celer]|uniref:SDR family oxidoreductase n=1 Tax=Mucilaginibacter celer TaxID=2305508 RepID=A0A494W0G9_9SPHI|nr:SDR family oxidoreductase [Mucilaginibacter celer]AYL97243.1 SDR family oxidoreductase [Mucilaginibacter celer]